MSKVCFSNFSKGEWLLVAAYENVMSLHTYVEISLDQQVLHYDFTFTFTRAQGDVKDPS